MAKGTVIIHPFSPAALNTSSYDVTLGEYYFREAEPQPGMGIYNPYSAAHVARVWGTTPLRAQTAGEWTKETGIQLENFADDDRIIWIKPGEVREPTVTRASSFRQQCHFTIRISLLNLICFTNNGVTDVLWFLYFGIDYSGSHQRVHWRPRQCHDDDEGSLKHGSQLHRDLQVRWVRETS